MLCDFIELRVVPCLICFCANNILTGNVPNWYIYESVTKEGLTMVVEDVLNIQGLVRIMLQINV